MLPLLSFPGASYQSFDPFAGATASLPSPPRVDPSSPPNPGQVPPLPDYNTLFTERIVIVDTDPNLRRTCNRRSVIGVMPCVSNVEPSAPELPPKDQIRVSPTLRRTFPELSDEEIENEPPQLEFTVPNFDEIRNTLNDGEIPPELEFFNSRSSLRFEQIINNWGINRDSRDFLNVLQDDLCQALMQRNKLSTHIETGNIYYDNIDTGESICSFFIAQKDHIKN